MLSLAAPMAWCYLLFFCRLVKYGEARENEGTEREAPGPALGICMSTKVIFRRTEVFVLAEVCLSRRPHAGQPRSDV